jgi:hypothetical protein
MRVDFFCFLDRHDIWQSIADLARHHARRGGVYRVHAFHEDAPREWRPENLVRVSRAAGEDEFGRLYLGSADACTARFISLWKSLRPMHGRRDAHAVGRTYLASAVLQRRYPRLCFTVRFAEEPAGAAAEELAAYAAEFGEQPPLNAALPDLLLPAQQGSILPGALGQPVGSPRAAIA